MKPALITCIVPVFNGEKYLADALDSIVAQTYRPLEIIVADDGSTDGTAAVVRAYKSRLRYSKQPNSGPAAARNLGVRGAAGEFVAFLDSDDLWHPEKLARQVACFERRPELAYCVTHVQNFWVPEISEEKEKFINHRLSNPLPGYVTQTLMARRAVFEIVGCFDPSLRHGDDTDWFLRATDQGLPAELIPDVLVYRRLHHANLSRAAAASREEYLRIVKMTLDRRRRNEARPPHSGSVGQQKKNP
jgi:glycosyltransferase involved in cell wall biosynthesis